MADVIAIDGPSASGKGTVASRVAAALGWNYLDSGALYRLTALYARWQGAAWSDEAAVAVGKLPRKICNNLLSSLRWHRRWRTKRWWRRGSCPRTICNATTP